MSRLVEGTKIRLESLDGSKHEYVIASKNAGSFHLHSLLVEDRVIQLTQDELQVALRKGRLEFISSSGDEEQKLAQDLMMFPEESRDEALRRYKYITGLIDRGVEYWSPQYIEDLVPVIAKEIDDRKPPSWITICRWHKKYVQAGFSIRGLYSETFKKGNRKSRLKAEVEECVRKALEYYQSELRPTKKDAYDRLEEYILEANTLRHVDDKLTVPSYRGFLNRVAKLTPYEKAASRHGKRKAGIEYDEVGSGVKTERVMERVAVDHTRLDLFVIDKETSIPLGRPWLTLAVDEYSRSIVGAYISFRDPDFIVLIKLIRNILEEKTYIKEKYPFIENDWACYGCPELFVFDNGKEFWCKDLEIVLAELNIQYAFNPVQHPWLKGKIERKFGTINTELLSQLQGKTFSSIATREDYDPKKNAVIKFDAFVEIFYKWLIDEYQVSPTTQEEIIPDLYWLKSVEDYPPKMIEPDRLNIILGRTEESKLRKGGIYYKKLRYESEDLARYRSKVGSKITRYKVDPDNLGFIYVFNELDREYIKVLAVDQDYASGLRENQHDVHIRYAKEVIGKDYKHEDVVRARLEIQRRIQEEIDSWVETPNKTAISASSAAAKYCDLGQDANSSLSEGLPAPKPRQNVKEQPESTVTVEDFDDDQELDTSGWQSNMP
ncbi:Mu transposase C-terminal domain-containing protein [Spongorhabdus nitratireducens]